MCIYVLDCLSNLFVCLFGISTCPQYTFGRPHRNATCNIYTYVNMYMYIRLSV